MNNLSYTEQLAEAFKDTKIELVEFDNGNTPESMCAYILVSNLDKRMLKDKGETVLDLGNYLYKAFGLHYEHTPEYHRSGEPKNSLAFYVSKERMDRMPHLKQWILDHKPGAKRFESVLYDRRRLTIPHNTKQSKVS
jgi:hypothetical protein